MLPRDLLWRDLVDRSEALRDRDDRVASSTMIAACNAFSAVFAKVNTPS